MRVRFDQIELDDQLFVLERGGKRLRVRPKVFDLLVHLIRQRERVVPREELILALWGTTAVGPGSLSGLVNELRQILGESGRGPSSIRTVHARGYQFAAAIEVLPATEVDGLERPRSAPLVAQALPTRLADALVHHIDQGEVQIDTVAEWLQAERRRRADLAARVMKKVVPDTQVRRSQSKSA